MLPQLTNLPTIPIRLTFTKKGLIKYTSHLDLCRTMREAFLRAGIPIWYTEGFNPHPKMVFGLTVSVGMESTCEFLDIKLTKETDLNEIKEKLNNTLPTGIRITNVAPPTHKLTEISWSSYLITTNDPFDLSKLDSKEINVLKRTKSGEKMVNIAPQIKKYQKTGDNSFELVLRSDNTDFLNPSLVADFLGIQGRNITRTGVFLEDINVNFS